jgi:hypothetical protein
MKLVPAPTQLRDELDGGQNRVEDLDDKLGPGAVNRQLLTLIRKGEVQVFPIGDHVNVALADDSERSSKRTSKTTADRRYCGLATLLDTAWEE